MQPFGIIDGHIRSVRPAVEVYSAKVTDMNYPIAERGRSFRIIDHIFDTVYSFPGSENLGVVIAPRSIHHIDIYFITDGSIETDRNLRRF